MRSNLRKVGIFVLASGCLAAIVVGPSYLPGRPTGHNFGRLKVGDSPGQTERVMGAPTSVFHDALDRDLVVYTWDTRREEFNAKFQKSVLTDKWSYLHHSPG